MFIGHRTTLAVPLLREGFADRRHPDSSSGSSSLFGCADQTSGNLRRPGGDRYRERSAVPRARDAQPRSAALHDVTAAASRSLEIKPVLDEVLEKITEIFKFDRVSIFLFDPKRETLTRMSTFGIAQEETGVRAFRRGQGLTGKVAETGQYMVFEDVRSDPRYRQLSQTNSMQQLGACFFALFPIKAKERFLGTINCIGKEPRKLKPDEIRLINSMCDQIGVAVENINLFEEVKNKTAELESSNSNSAKRWSSKPRPARSCVSLPARPPSRTGSGRASCECREALWAPSRVISVSQMESFCGLSLTTMKVLNGSRFYNPTRYP